MNHFNKYFLFALSLLLLDCSSSQNKSNYWTKFRGVDGLGIDIKTRAPFNWEESDLKWKVPLPGIGNASPVVWRNKIFVPSADDAKDTGYLTAVDGKDGKVVWQMEFKVTDLNMHMDNNLAAQTPAVDKSQVYIVWYSNEKTTLIALTHDGTIRWQSEFGGILSRHGGGSSLTLTDECVIFTREQEKDYSTYSSSWLAVDKKTGKTVWELERESPEYNSFATPLLLKRNNQPTQLIFASQSHGLTGVVPETGKVLWERKNLFPSRVVASPFYSDAMIVVSRNGETLVIDMDSISNQAKDSARYSLPHNLSTYVPTPIVVNKLLFTFMDNGTVACIQLATGELLWKERPSGAIYGSPICVNGNLYCITKEGKVLVIRADSTYQLLGINELGEGSYSTPVMCNSGMVFRTFTQLMMFGMKLNKFE
jgi:outer membrane protein assembly factor BamB